jgi:hypothetical protein
MRQTNTLLLQQLQTQSVPWRRQALPKPVATVHDVNSVHTSQCPTITHRTLCTAVTVLHGVAQTVDTNTHKDRARELVAGC